MGLNAVKLKDGLGLWISSKQLSSYFPLNKFETDRREYKLRVVLCTAGEDALDPRNIKGTAEPGSTENKKVPWVQNRKTNQKKERNQRAVTRRHPLRKNEK